MKLKNGEIWLAKQPLEKLVDVKLPIKTSYALAKLVNKLNEQLQVIDAVRMGLIKKYELPSQNPEKHEKWPDFVKDFNELMEQETEVVIEKVKLPDDIQLETSILLSLTKFVEV